MAISAEHHHSIFLQNMHASSIFLSEVLFTAYKIGKQDRKGRGNINPLTETRHSHHIWKSFRCFNALTSLEKFGGSRSWGARVCQKQHAGFPASAVSLLLLCFLSHITHPVVDSVWTLPLGSLCFLSARSLFPARLVRPLWLQPHLPTPCTPSPPIVP